MDTALLDLEFYSHIFAESHLHLDPEVIYVMEGEADITVDDTEYHLSHKDFILINASRRHSYQVDQKSLIGSLHLPYRLISAHVKSDAFFVDINSVTAGNRQDLSEIAKILEELFLSGYDSKNIFSLYRLYYKLMEVITLKFIEKGGNESDRPSGNNRLAEIEEYINRNLQQNASLSGLADHLYLSNSYLSKYFKKHFGANFLDYVNDVRISRALSDIRYTNHSMTKVALNVGFTNLRMFNKVFKAKYGVSPTLYRSEFRRNASSDHEPEPAYHAPAASQPQASNSTEPADCINEHITVPHLPQMELNNFWSQAINIGTAEELLLSDVQGHVLKLKNKLHFRYIRFWSLYTKSMFLNYHEVGKTYNYNRLDRILDFLVSNQLKPVIEIANKNKIISRYSGDKRSMVPSETNLFYSRDLVEYFFKELAEHLVSRYGHEEVGSWQFELWMEENERIFVKRVVLDEDIDKHVHLFAVIAEAMRQVIPGIQIGTGGFSIRYDNQHIGKIITALEKSAQQPDFITFYAFPYARPDKNYVMERQTINPDYLAEKAVEIQGLLKHSSLKSKKLFMSEWNLTAYNRNAINDSCYKAAYLMKNIIGCIGSLDMLTYWLGSDLYGDFIEDNFLIIGAAGLLSKDGIAKPAWYVFEFMNALGQFIYDKSDNYLITGDKKGNWMIVCHNYKSLNYYYHIQPEDMINLADISNMITNNIQLSISFRFNASPNDKYRTKTFSVNRQHGSIQDEWVNMLQPERLDKEDIEHLKNTCVPDIKIQTISEHMGKIIINTVLEPNEIQLIMIHAE